MTVTASIDTLVSGVAGARDEANLRSVLAGLDAAIGLTEAANVAAVGTLTAAAGDADHTNVVADLATLKTAINAILTALKAAGLMASS